MVWTNVTNFKARKWKSINELNKIAELFSKELWKEKRIERVNYNEIIELFTCTCTN